MRNLRDWQSIVYVLLLPLLVLWQWQQGFSWPLYLLQLFLTLGIGVVHHNHTHVRIWFSRGLNRITDLILSILQGHPTFVFYPSHIANHHRYQHGEQDAARTYQFITLGARGDSNHLLGYLLHPLQAAWVLYPHFIAYLKRRYQFQRVYFYYCVLQYFLIISMWVVLAIIDWQKWLVLVLIPQLHGLHWLLATNYLQHAHADGRGHNLNFARNFYGWVNPLLFNIGLHTAHHRHPRAHWSQLPRLAEHYAAQVDLTLNEKGLLRYMLRTYIFGLLHPRWRTRSLHNKD